MKRQWADPVIRCLVYLYFSAGIALLVSNGRPALLLLVPFGATFGLLCLASWDTFPRPISRRKWIPLCIVLSLGIFVLIFPPTLPAPIFA